MTVAHKDMLFGKTDTWWRSVHLVSLNAGDEQWLFC